MASADRLWGFPGQGVAWEGVLARLREGAGDPLLGLLADRTGVEDWAGVDPADTRRAQAAILVASLLGVVGLDREGVVAVAGHSFGELAALVVGGVLDASSAVDLALLRGELGAGVQEATGGGMLAVVSVPEDEVERLRVEALAAVPGTCVVAVRNHGVQVVLSGSRPTLEWVEARVPPLGGRAHVLPIGGPYHTPFMAEAASAYAAAVGDLPLRPPLLPVLLSTSPGVVAGEADLADLPARLGRSLVDPVEWPRTLTAARALGAARGLDVGPGNVLARIGRRAGLPFDAVWLPPDP